MSWFFKHHHYQVMQLNLFCSVIDEKTKQQDEKHPHEQQMKYFGKVIKTLSHPSNKFTSICFHYVTLIISTSIKLQFWSIYYSCFILYNLHTRKCLRIVCLTIGSYHVHMPVTSWSLCNKLVICSIEIKSNSLIMVNILYTVQYISLFLLVRLGLSEIYKCNTYCILPCYITLSSSPLFLCFLCFLAAS